ncbi:MAG: dihydrofolate reductase family protein, partial [Actinomycetota bacterium]|nr:dihydrofolate reductase family protein [Actinomycetota bacterium]
RVDTFLYGRVVWDLMSGYWPTADQISDHPHDLAFAKVWRQMPKIVFSRTLTEAGWGARVESDVASALRDLKAQPGKDLLLTGGAELAATLAGLDLIDEYQIVVHPVVLGDGKRLFPFAERFDLKLAETRTFDGRAVLLSYRR